MRKSVNIGAIRCTDRFAVHIAPLLFNAFLIFSSPNAVAQELPPGCGSLWSQGRFGPYDYRPSGYISENTYGSHKALLFIVENAHFTPEVEALIRGKTTAAPGGDISYTLHAFPNHHRALISMVALSRKENTPKPSGSAYNVECWFSRAIAFKPDDTVVRMIYANYLVMAKRYDEAEQQLTVATNQAGDNAFTHNNIGLIYFGMQNYEKALMHAHKAYELGLRVPTLLDKLKSVGKWTEPAGAVPIESAVNPQLSASEPSTTSEK
jgi:tetratricopeptide (TPR) repeat protein